MRWLGFVVVGDGMGMEMGGDGKIRAFSLGGGVSWGGFLGAGGGGRVGCF